RLADSEALLIFSVEPYRVFVIAVAQAVIEDAGAGADHRLAALERQPRDAEAGREIEFINQVRLKFVAQAVRERQIRPHAEVVHDKPRPSKHVVIDQWIARVYRELIRARIGDRVVPGRVVGSKLPVRVALRTGRISERQEGGAILIESRKGISAVEIASAQVV